MEEGDRPLGAAARGRVDQLDPADLEAEERLGEVRDLEADVMEALALPLEEAGDAGRVIGRLDQLDLRLPHPEEGDPDPIVRDVHDRLDLEGERVAPETERFLDRADDQRDMVDPPDPANGRGNPGAARTRSLG